MTVHLGDRVSALADGQLGLDERERALSHVARCPMCAAELEAARTARRRLSQACDVAPTAELTERLLALSASIPPADKDPLRAPDRDTSWQTPDAWRAPLTGDVAGETRRRRRRLALVGAGGVGVLGCALFVLGQAPVVSPENSRAASLSALAGGASATSTTEEVRAAGFISPASLPVGYEVVAVRSDGDSAEIELRGPDGPVVVREERGRLADVAATDANVDVLEGADVHVLSRDPWHVAWQAGDVVVEATTDAPEEVLADVVAAFPGQDYDAGVLPRLTRGWTTMTGAITSP